jgi:hypothetical protein
VAPWPTLRDQALTLFVDASQFRSTHPRASAYGLFGFERGVTALRRADVVSGPSNWQILAATSSVLADDESHSSINEAAAVRTGDLHGQRLCPACGSVSEV